jgi:transposase
LTTKVHVVTDGLGNPLSFLLSPGNRNDIVHAEKLLDTHDLRGKMVLADMGYDSADFRRYIIGRGGIPVIPNRVTNRIQWDFDEEAYSERCLVENLFMKMKNCRRFATRYEKLAASYLAVVHLAAVLIWLF